MAQTTLMPTGEQLLFDFVRSDMSALYDRIYDIADRLFKKHNPCNIHTTKKGFVLCKGYNHYTDIKDAQKHGHFLCCTGCKHQSKDGCTIKCLPCKLYHCSAITRYKIIRERLNRLKKIATANGIYLRCWLTKDEILNESLKRFGG